jgi:hypothetical protein
MARFSVRPHALNTMVLILTLSTRSYSAPLPAFAPFFLPPLSPQAVQRVLAGQERRAFALRQFSSRAPRMLMGMDARYGQEKVAGRDDGGGAGGVWAGAGELEGLLRARGLELEHVGEGSEPKLLRRPPPKLLTQSLASIDKFSRMQERTPPGP